MAPLGPGTPRKFPKFGHDLRAVRSNSFEGELMIQQIADGRTDLVFDYLAQGHAATAADPQGT